MSKVKFKLPRKKKKFLKKGIWLYPANQKGNSLSASPAKCEEDYIAFKKGHLRNLLDRNKKKHKEFVRNLNREITVSDEVLLTYVNEIFAEKYRRSSYDLLIKAKRNKRSVKAYYNFLNAYEFYKNGNDSYGNICCMSVDLAKDLLKPRKK